MKIFADTADVEKVREAHELGLVDGVTTNPSLVADTGREYETVVRELNEFVEGPISVQVVATNTEEMVQEALEYDTWGDDIVVKVPMTRAGVKALTRIDEHDIETNATCLFSPIQALIAAKNGASYVSPWFGNVNDAGYDGYALLENTIEILDNYDFDTEVIVADVRNAHYITETAKMGADVLTLPPWVFEMLWDHPLTNAYLDELLDDWGDREGPV